MGAYDEDFQEYSRFLSDSRDAPATGLQPVSLFLAR